MSCSDVATATAVSCPSTCRSVRDSRNLLWGVAATARHLQQPPSLRSIGVPGSRSTPEVAYGAARGTVTATDGGSWTGISPFGVGGGGVQVIQLRERVVPLHDAGMQDALNPCLRPRRCPPGDRRDRAVGEKTKSGSLDRYCSVQYYTTSYSII